MHLWRSFISQLQWALLGYNHIRYRGITAVTIILLFSIRNNRFSKKFPVFSKFHIFAQYRSEIMQQSLYKSTGKNGFDRSQEYEKSGMTTVIPLRLSIICRCCRIPPVSSGSQDLPSSLSMPSTWFSCSIVFTPMSSLPRSLLHMETFPPDLSIISGTSVR